MKILSFLAPFISQIKTADIFNFWSVKYFGKGLLFLKTWHIRVTYCWNYGPSNLLFCFFRSFVIFFFLAILITDRPKWQKTLQYIFLKATTKTSVWWKFQVLWSTHHEMTSFNFFAKLNGNHILMAHFPKLCKYQTFAFIESNNLSKG